MAANLHGANVTESELMTMQPISSDGMTPAQYEEMVQRLGLRLIERRLDQFESNSIYLAKYINHMHVLITVDKTGERLLVHNPTKGKYSLQKDQLVTLFEATLYKVVQEKDIATDGLIAKGELHFYTIQNSPEYFVGTGIEPAQTYRILDINLYFQYKITPNRYNCGASIDIRDDTSIIKQLCNTHRNLFHQIDPNAGSLRQIRAMRGGGHYFVFPTYIESCLYQYFKALPHPSAFLRCDTLQTASAVAPYISDLNLIHPFFNGNGRTIKLFFTEYLATEGISMDFSQVTKSEDYHAFYHAKIGQIEPLISLLRKCLPNSTHTASGEKQQING
jgi:cell filamentation protein